MKAIIFSICLLLTFINCAAPELNKKIQERDNKKVTEYLERIVYEAEFLRFAQDLRGKESPDWTKINELGCMGWFQFAPGTLRWLGYGNITPGSFAKDPEIFSQELQIKVLQVYIKSNQLELQDCIDAYEGKTINGVLITRSGILAGAHLGGPTGVRLYLVSNGAINRQDMNGTSIQDYIKHFQGYDI
jgi:hypothetical protein